MKNSWGKVNNHPKIVSMIAAAVFSFLLCANAFATTKNVTIRIQGWDDGNGEILDEYEVTLTDQTGFSVMDALNEACDANSITYVATDGYVSEIAGQGESDFDDDFYSGWMYRVWEDSDQPSDPDEDVLSWYGAADYILNDGDKVSWYFALPEYSRYTIMSNYGSIDDTPDESTNLTVWVKAEVFNDLWMWDLSGYVTLGNVTVVVERISDSTVIGSATTVATGWNKGKATISLPSVTADTPCYVYVQAEYYISGDEEDGTKHVKSWRKGITIQNL